MQNIPSETRPNLTVEFYLYPDDYVSLRDTYIKEGLLARSPPLMSADRLTKTIQWEFVDQAARDKWAAEPLVIRYTSQHNSYNELHGIVRGVAGA